MALTFNAASSTPNSGNTAVPLNAYIKLVFNSEVQSAYFSPTAVGTYFQLYKEAGFVKYGVIAGRTVDNNLAIYLLPMAKLEPNTKYTLIIVGGTNGIKNIANETLTGNQVISFTTTYFADNQISINITDSVVTFPPVAQEPVPIPTPPGSVVNFQDVNNLVGSESGIAEFYYEDGSQIGQIFIEHSNPEEFTIGNIDFYQFVSYWNEDIRSRYADEIKITKAKLPFDTVNFLGNTPVPHGSVQIVGNKLSFAVTSESGYDTSNNPLTLNYEYQIRIPGAALSKLDDGGVRNANIIVKFAGPLAPLFSTPDMVKAIMSSSFNPEDIGYVRDYDLFKKIHWISYELVNRLGYTPSYNDPNIYWVVRYVTCRAAYELLTGPLAFVQYVTQRTVLGQSVSYTNKDRTMPGDRGELENCMTDALNALGILMSNVAAVIGVKSKNSAYYPGRKRGNMLRSFTELNPIDTDTNVPRDGLEGSIIDQWWNR